MLEKLRKRYVIAALRKASLWWPERTKAKGLARVDRGLYRCAICMELFGPKEIQLDHIAPIVPETGWDGFGNYIRRLFCAAEELQVLCRRCHGKKTKSEKSSRAKARTRNTKDN